MKKTLTLIAGVCLSVQAWAAPSEQAVVEHYADLAQAMYQDSLSTARVLQQAVDKLVAKPNKANLQTARAAWKAARAPYMQTEVYRFGNAIVDDWEGKVNAWPLDEGLIDYVAVSYGRDSDINPFYTANVIANKQLTFAGQTIDATVIDGKLLAETLHEVDEVVTNVAIGYHAIEFMLWGQDLNGSGPGAGNRPASDFDTNNCSWGNCDRRAAYLKAATDLLVKDLKWMNTQWGKNGAARTNLTQGDMKQGLATIFTGMGSLAYGELAGERMQLGLMLHDPEEEQDCFSDNTHSSHFNDALGIKNVYTGTYTRVDGSKLSGPSASDLVAAKDAGVDKLMRERLDATLSIMQVLVDSAEKDGIAYDQLIGEGNDAGNAKVQAAIDALLEQTKATESAVAVLNLGSIIVEGSDSLDAPSRVLQ